jgi:hypothetical protein
MATAERQQRLIGAAARQSEMGLASLPELAPAGGALTQEQARIDG